jgi:hypothetical protein
MTVENKLKQKKQTDFKAVLKWEIEGAIVDHSKQMKSLFRVFLSLISNGVDFKSFEFLYNKLLQF